MENRVRFPGCAAAFVLCCAALLPAGGCGKSNTGVRGAVKGKVTLDGQPLQQGRITFEPTAGTEGPVSGVNIKDGVYEMDAERGAAIGKNLVRINALKPSGKKMPSAFGGEETDEMVEAIPETFNAKTTLERDVRAGENTLDFELTSE